MQREAERKQLCDWHLFFCADFNEVGASRLATWDQPLPSKPVIPRWTILYILFEQKVDLEELSAVSYQLTSFN